MNSLRKYFQSIRFLKKGAKGAVLSIVILLEILIIALVATYAWVETVSSIKITNLADTVGSFGTYVYTDAMIGDDTHTIDLAGYFKQAGDMHFAPASSADGKTFYFPKANVSDTSGFIYRKGNVSDKNTAYMSVTFRLKADTNADFFFTKAPTFSALGDDMRVSVTALSEGSTAAPVTKIYANSASTPTTKVVNSTTGSTGSTTYEKFSDHIKGKSSQNRLFAVGANETKVVTINVWLQKKADNNNEQDNTDLTSNMSQAITITNLGITSDLTPRHVTLIPTPTWDQTSSTEYFYAWCWDSSKGDASRLYKLELDENEHYAFSYNGTYRKTLFIRSGNANLTKEYLESGHWNDNTIWNVTDNTTIPNDPVDPTFIIQTINGSSEIDTSSGTSSTSKKSTGDWNSPATVKVAYVTDQNSDWGTLSATSYIGSTTSTHVMESTNSSSSKHKDTVHAWIGKCLQLKATAKTNYAFVGWFTDEAGTQPASGTVSGSNLTTTAPSTATDITYYAKFKEVRTLTINRIVDGSASSTAAAGTITINGSTTANTATTKSVTVDKGSSVTFSAAAATGYHFDGFFTTADGNSRVNSPLNPINSNTTYYARFTPNSYNVTANALYSTNSGTSYTAGDTGGTVQAGSAEAGATSTASVKYKSSVNVVATPASGYDFDGWYSEASGGTFLSANQTYTVDVSTVGDKEVYAKFKEQKTTTIYMTYRGYSKMRVYVYGKSTNRKYNGDFPGATVPTYTVNRGLYSYTFKTGQDEDIGIIVSDDGSDSVRDEYTAHVGETILIGPHGSSIDRNFSLGTKRYVYFTKNWNTNYIHYWGGSSGSSTWPGVKMTQTAYTNDMNQDVLYYVINTGNTGVIFSENGSNQTGDTSLDGNSCFYFDGANKAAGTWSPSTE
ncbi:MAG: starch-binding protein [Ruminococcus sp.]|nr:starch-binding protein [Ruminococcus sp.]